MQHNTRLKYIWAVSSIILLACFAFAANKPTIHVQSQLFDQDGSTQLSSQFQQDWFHLRGTTPSTVFNGLVQNGSNLYLAGRISNNALGLGLDMLVARYDATTGNLGKNVSWGPITDASYQDANAIAVSGNAVFAAGYSAEKALVVKFDQDLNYIWNSTLGKTSCTGLLTDIALDGTNIYVCGSSYMAPVSDDGIVLKYNSSGSLVWNQTWGGTGQDRFSSIIIDGNLVRVFGQTGSYGAGSTDMVMVTYDADGNFKNYTCWGTSTSEICSSAVKLGGYFYMAGIGEFPGKGDEAVLVKLAPNGTPVWNRTWGNPDTDEINCITSNGTHLFVAGVSYIKEDNQAFFAEYDENGGMLGERTFGVTLDYEEAIGILVTDNSIFVCGDDVLNAGGEQGFIARFTSLQSGPSNLQQSWKRTWGGSSWDEFDDVVAYNGSIYVTGYAGHEASEENNLVFNRYDPSGTIISSFTLSTIGNVYGYRMAVGADCIYVAGGWKNASINRRLLNLFKFDLNGNFLWNRTWGKTTFDTIGPDSIAVNGTGIFISGAYHEDGKSITDREGFVVKFYDNGTQAWNATTEGYGTQTDSFINVIVDGGIVRVAGYLDANIPQNYHHILNNYDAGGILINTTAILSSGEHGDHLKDMILYNNSFYVTASHTFEGGISTFVARLDKSGNELWRSHWTKDGYDYSSRIVTNGTDLFVAGISRDGEGTYRSSLLDLDMDGRVLGYKLWNASLDDEAYGIACVNDTIYVAGGIYDPVQSDAYLVKFVPATSPGPTVDTGWIVAIVIIGAIAGAVVVLYFLDKKKVINLQPFFKKVRDTTGPAFMKMGNGIKSGFNKTGKGKGAVTAGAAKDVDAAHKAEEARQKAAADEEARRKAEEESKRKADEEAQRKAELEKQQAKEEAKRKADAEAKAAAAEKAALEAAKAKEKLTPAKSAATKPAKKAAIKPSSEKPAGKK
nr:cell envelope integrity protein TolA [Candidatus Sigynarchaeota archaeon]